MDGITNPDGSVLPFDDEFRAAGGPHDDVRHCASSPAKPTRNLVTRFWVLACYIWRINLMRFKGSCLLIAESNWLSLRLRAGCRLSLRLWVSPAHLV